jgi:hypothetical protein
MTWAARWLAAGCLGTSLVAWADTAPTSMPTQGDWRFQALLDGKPIGTHRFTLSTQDGVSTLRSEASFDVKLLGLTVYRYRHQATEHWRGGCLVGLTSTTDDDGTRFAVQASQHDGALRVSATKGQTAQPAHTLPGCVMTYAYWNPAMRQQGQLLNAQTGRYETVTITALGNDRWRVKGPEQPIELTYSAQGDWVGLDSKVSGGKRTLSYQLE